jgi:hypothetical protein
MAYKQHIAADYELCKNIDVHMYMLSGCELIDTENISLPSQDMKFLAIERSERDTNIIFCRAG